MMMKKPFLAAMLGVFALASCMEDSGSIESELSGMDMTSYQIGQTPLATSSLKDYDKLIAVTEVNQDTPEKFAEKIQPDYVFGMIDMYLGMDSRALTEPLFNLMVEKRVPQMDKLFEGLVGTGKNGQRQWQIESYVFNYKSKTPQGEDIVLSGRVTFPNNTIGQPHEVQSLSLHSHQMLIDHTWSPTEHYSFMTLRAFMNSAVIEPDFQGYGVDLYKHIYAISATNNQAEQMKDCILAAYQVMAQHGVTLKSAEDGGFTTNWGCSIAAAVPIAFAKYCETDPEGQELNKIINLHSSFAAEGPLDIAELYKELDKDCYWDPTEDPDNYIYPHYAQKEYLGGNAAQLLYFFGVYTAKDFGGYEPYQFLHSSYTSKKKNWSRKVTDRHGTVTADYTNPEYFQGQGNSWTYFDVCKWQMTNAGIFSYWEQPYANSFHDIMNEEMFGEDGHLDYSKPKTKAFFDGIAKWSDIYGWTPRLPIYMGQNKTDEAMPYQHARTCYEKLSNNGLNKQVQWVEPPILGTGSPLGQVGNHLFVSVIMMLEMACAEYPANMADFYTELFEEED
jgi:hypothetical protein